MKRQGVVVGRALAAAVLWGAAAAGAALAETRPVVFVSIPPQAWLAKRLAGDAVQVETLLAPGANPHTYEPGARQVKRLSEAALFLTVGLAFERPLAARAARLNPALTLAAADAGIVKRGAHAHHHEPGHTCGADGGDPHVWLSPRLFGAMASNTAAALTQLLPARRAALAAALAATAAEIAETDRAVRDALLAAAGRTWVSYHPSWSYFSEDYGLRLLTIEQDGKTPSARHLATVIGEARAAGVRAVFAEPQYDPRPAQTLAAQVGARLETADPLAEEWPALLRDVAAKLAR